MVSKRIDILIFDITLSFYEKICRGLFVKDQMQYSFLIITSILKQEGREVSELDWNFFLKGSSINYKTDDFDLDYMKIEQYYKFLCMQDCGFSFKKISSSLRENKEIWKNYLESDDPFNCEIPSDMSKEVNDFQKLCLVRMTKRKN